MQPITDPFQSFLTRHAFEQTAPLLAEKDGWVLVREARGGKLLCRHPEFEALMVRTVEEGLLDPTWLGFVYVMHWKLDRTFVPLYIGKAERRGKKHDLSVNLKDIRRNQHKFGRWGDGRAYHIGDLSHAIFDWPSYKPVDPRYPRWVERLFASTRPLVLRHPVYVTLISWRHGDLGPRGTTVPVALLEQELIHLVKLSPLDLLLNVDTDPY